MVGVNKRSVTNYHELLQKINTNIPVQFGYIKMASYFSIRTNSRQTLYWDGRRTSCIVFVEEITWISQDL